VCKNPDMHLLVGFILGVSLAFGASPVTVRPTLNFAKTFGGSGYDAAAAVAVDAAGNVYVAGSTTSTDFPVANALQAHLGGIPLHSSTDGGKTWSTPGIPWPVYAAAGSPKTPQVLFAGTTNGMYKSADAGKTWSALPGAGNVLVNAVIVDELTASTVYAATARGIIKSIDSGANWRVVDAGGYVLALAAQPGNPGVMIEAIDPEYSFSFGNPAPSLFRTIDGGATWSALSNGPPNAYAVAFDASNPSTIYAGSSQYSFYYSQGGSVYRSTDGGTTWAKLADIALSSSTFSVA
jgi:hypothetical protein